MTDLEPGFYKATVRGVADVTVMVCDWNYSHRNITLAGVAGLGSERDTLHTHVDNQITDARPLIVLDLEGLDVQTLADVVRGGWPEAADQIEAQTKPTRPTPLALVALIRGADTSEQGERLLEMWLAQDGPTLIREGVTS